RAVAVAAQDVRDKVSRVRGRLPVDILEPVIAKQEADAQPFIYLALSGANYDLMQLSDVADRVVKTRLQSLPGVGSAQIFGERRYAMRVWVKPDQLSARGLTVQDVEGAIASRNVEIPAGRIESTRREFSVRSLGELKTPQEFGEMVVASQGSQLIKLKDVARVELGPEDDRSIFRYNGSPSVAIGVVRQSKANLLDVARNIRQAIPDIQRALPIGVKLQSAYDGSVFVTHSIDDARLTLLIAAILVVLTPLAFLTGTAGRLLSEFGIAVAGAVVISGFVALTLTPMLCAKILRMQHQHGKVFQMFESGFNALSERYAQLLRRAVDHRVAVLLGALAVVAVSVGAFLVYPGTRLQKELIPNDDRGFFLVAVQGPEGASLRYTDSYVRQVEQIIGRTPDVNGYFTIIGGFAGGVNSAFIGVIMKDWSERHT